jgi:serine/threonine-protein kinase
MGIIDSIRTDILTPEIIIRYDIAQFLQGLKQSRLLADGEVRELERAYASSNLADLIEKLIADEKLTRYQVNRLLQGDWRGLVVGSYQILDELGRGSVGKVYKARHTMMERVVALKVTTLDEHREKSARDQFRREVAAITRLNHPNVAMTYDANEVDGVLYLAMEYVDGSTLQRQVAEEGPLPVSKACLILLQTARALQHAHENGLVHRDIKPGNLMLPESPTELSDTPTPPVLVKVVDFGLARLQPRKDSQFSTLMCREGATMGTPAFIAPEQIRDVHAADIRSDLYSLGCTFYFALTGHLPFEGGTTQATLTLHLEQPPRAIRSLRSAIPKSVAAIIHRLLAKKPFDRYQTPADLIEDLNHVVLSGDLYERDPEDTPLPVPPSWRTSSSSNDTPHCQDADLSPEETQPLSACPLPTDARLAATSMRKAWLEWLSLINQLMEGSPPSLREAEYKLLYRNLLDAIQVAREASGGSFSERYQQLHLLVEPWVSLISLVSLDERTLRELAETCRSIDAAFWPRQVWTGSSWLVPILFVLVLGGALLGVACNNSDGTRALLGDLVRSPQTIGALVLIPIVVLFVVIAGRKGQEA